MVLRTPVKGAIPINYHLKMWSIHFASLLAMLNPMKSTSVVIIATMRNTVLCDRSHHMHIYGTTTSTSDELNTKEDTGKSMRNILYVLWYAKRHLLGWCDEQQARSLSCYQIMPPWLKVSVSQAVSIKSRYII